MKHGHTHGMAIGAYHLLKWQVSVFTLAGNPMKNTPLAECNRLNFDYRFRSDFFISALPNICFFATPFFRICRHTTTAVQDFTPQFSDCNAYLLSNSWKAEKPTSHEESQIRNLSSVDKADTLDWMCSWWSCALNTWRSSLTLFLSLLRQNKWHFFAQISNNKLQVVALENGVLFYTHVKRTKTARRSAGNEILVYGVLRTPFIHNVFDCVPIAKTIG